MSIHELTERYLCLNPEIAECLSLGLINRSSLARLVAEAYDLDSIDAASAASRRLADSFDPRLSPSNTITEKFSLSSSYVRVHLVSWTTPNPREQLLTRLAETKGLQLFTGPEPTSEQSFIVTEPLNSSSAELILRSLADTTLQLESIELCYCEINAQQSVLRCYREISDFLMRRQQIPLLMELNKESIRMLVSPEGVNELRNLAKA